MRLSTLPKPRSQLWLLAPGQLISWGTLYYGITFLAQPIHQSTGWSLAAIFGAYSGSLLLAALCAPQAARFLDRHGGRWGLSTGSWLGAISLLSMASTHHQVVFLLAWLLAGAAMSLTLYEAAFTALREFNEQPFRQSMTTLTLVGGFASTLFWPLSFWLEAHLGWRQTLLVFAALHAFVCLPLHRQLPRRQPPPAAARTSGKQAKLTAALLHSPVYWMLALAIAATALINGAISTHISLLLTGLGISSPMQLLIVTLLGPMQVAGRLIDMMAAHRLPVRWSGYLAHLLLLVALGLLLLTTVEPRLALLFMVLYGTANGILTIVRGMAPAELLADASYGTALAWISSPGLVSRAFAPTLVAFSLTQWGNMVTLQWLVAISTVGLVAFVLAYRTGKASASPAIVAIN